MFWLIVIVAIYYAFCTYRIACKAGAENAWFAFIPFANVYLLTEIANVPWYWLLGCLVPYLGGLVVLWLMLGLSEALCEPSPQKYLICIPGLNIFYMSYLAFRKEPAQYKTNSLL